MSKKLKRCPFCKNTDVGLNDTKEWVTCNKCWAEGPYGTTEDDAVNLWNTRAGEKS